MSSINFISPEQAAGYIQSGDSVYIHSVAAAPQFLINAFMQRAHELRNVRILHLHTEGEAPYANPEYEGIFKVCSFFVGPNVRQAIKEGRADYMPLFLSEVPLVIRQRLVPIDVALISVSLPDKHGYVSLGCSVDSTLAAVQMSKKVIAQVNRFMPRALGDAPIHVSSIDHFVESDIPLPEAPMPKLSQSEMKIGEHIATLVDNGATLQMGIGSIPNAALANLTNHKGLGVHTEMFSDGLLPLIERGVITNEYKKIHPNHIVSSFVMGTRKVYDFIHNNPRVLMLDAAFVNDTAIIRQNPKVTAINSAIEIDLTGQVCADSIGTSIYSGVGGQMDFIRGASYSPGGKPIIAVNSTTAKGESKIVPTLKTGAGVVTTRANVHYVVTEYGIANLYGKTLKERAVELIRIAHPNHREALERAAYDRWKGRI
ncbi:4-hydroxybutyrate CoA-transferase [Sphingobacteriales bacterium UPWRP_1]|nr:4-hydroxybutyrate CoA-transferase [Sphingobacteriales bacterium TSM_CSS]PSJ78646.1 4-hydroxybutyrate CoA-transferase [Sphingobacteriales bacterium UPWRP_1]